MWRSAGLHISEDGYILPSNDTSNHEPMHDDMISNAMIWLVMKIVNFLTAYNDLSSEPSLLPVDDRQQSLLDYWNALSLELDTWHSGLPDSFRPISTTWPDKNQQRPPSTSPNSSSNASIPKKWFARPMCASTMQWYHFARILLLHHRPYSSPTTRSHPSDSTDNDNNNDPYPSPASITRETRHHALEIISIGLAQTDDGVRVHSVQALYGAGQALAASADDDDNDDDEDGSGGEALMAKRLAVVRLLRDVGRDTGWETAYRVRQLLELWRLPADWGA